MVRANFAPDPSIQRFEAYMNFIGGLNIETSNETLRENEFTVFDNLDLSTRGSAKRRTGRINTLGFEFGSTDVGQGMFFFYRADQTTPDRILAINGKLYRFPPTPWSVNSETPTGTINGTNKVFTLANPFIQKAITYPVADNQTLVANDLVILNTSNKIEKYVSTGTIMGYVKSFDSIKRTAEIYEFVATVDGTITSAFTLNFRTGVITFTNAPATSVSIKYKYQLKLITVENLPSNTFQTTKAIEAVQVDNDLYIATGTEFCMIGYSDDPAWVASTAYVIGDRVIVTATGRLYVCTIAGTSDATTAPSHTSGAATNGTATFTYIGVVSEKTYAKVVEPYKPSVLEVLNIGTNGLASNPNTWIQDTTDELSAAALTIKTVTPSTFTPVVNQTVTFTVYYTKTSGITTAQGQWEYKRSDETTWATIKAFTDFPSGKTHDFVFPSGTKYDIRVSVRDKAHHSNLVVFYLDEYNVNLYNPVNDAVLRTTSIDKCTKIRLHWDRLILSGDDTDPYQIYISDLNAPNYFPTTNTINFDIGKKEAIVSIVRYKSDLIIFTRSTVQGLYGKSPEDYTRRIIHDNIGCIAPLSAKVIRDDIFFLSDQGLYRLYPTPLAFENLRLTRVDTQIRSAIPYDEKSSAMVYDNQYWICFPSQSLIYRYYYDIGSWTRDKSNYLNIIEFEQYAEDIYNFTEKGNLWLHDTSVYYDINSATPYEMIVNTKFLDLSAQFNYKKIRRMYVLGRHFNGVNNNMEVRVYADSALVLTPDSGYASVDPATNTVIWNTTTQPNMYFYTGTDFGSWLIGQSAWGDVQLSVQRADVRGKSRRVKVSFLHDLNAPFELYGFGLEYKIKRV